MLLESVSPLLSTGHPRPRVDEFKDFAPWRRGQGAMGHRRLWHAVAVEENMLWEANLAMRNSVKVPVIGREKGSFYESHG